METPRSGKSQSRFNTPVSDLDDHRHQASTIPRSDTISSGRRTLPRRNTAQSGVNVGRLDLLEINENLRETGPVSRDFEQVNMDDERSGNGENMDERRGSTNPAAYRGTGRRSQVAVNRSRDSSPSSRSTSPANSVDAFADPRRRERANTVGSTGPSELDLGIQRTISGGTNCRRPTFSNGSIRQLDHHNDGASYHNPAEDDVCFPVVEDSSKTYKIDFQELDEFVAESTRGKPLIASKGRQKLSFSSQGNKPRFFQCLSPRNEQIIPKIVTHSSSPTRLGSECAIDDDASIFDEKVIDPLDANGPPERIPCSVEPHRFSFFSSEMEQTIHAAEFADLLSPGTTSCELFNLPEDSGVWWMNVVNPTEDELNVFKGAFGIHRLTTEDIITQEAREKVELFKQYYFVCFRSFYQMDKNSEQYMEPVNVYMVVFRQGILTFTYTQSPHAANVRKRIGKLRDYMLLGADWICYAMMYVYHLIPNHSFGFDLNHIKFFFSSFFPFLLPHQTIFPYFYSQSDRFLIEAMTSSILSSP